MNGRTTNWLEEANWDLENARILFENDRFNTVVFHCQQAAEKAVKALLYHNKINGWGHSIHSLLEKYKDIKNANFEDIERTAIALTNTILQLVILMLFQILLHIKPIINKKQN